MPIYDYYCEKCEREFEVEQRITDAPIKTCRHCRSRRVKRLISQTSFVLKGGGWYSDLYSSSSGKADAAEKSADAPTGEKAGEKTAAAETGASGGADKPASSSKSSRTRSSFSRMPGRRPGNPRRSRS